MFWFVAVSTPWPLKSLFSSWQKKRWKYLLPFFPFLLEAAAANPGWTCLWDTFFFFSKRRLNCSSPSQRSGGRQNSEACLTWLWDTSVKKGAARDLQFNYLNFHPPLLSKKRFDVVTLKFDFIFFFFFFFSPARKTFSPPPPSVKGAFVCPLIRNNFFLLLLLLHLLLKGAIKRVDIFPPPSPPLPFLAAKERQRRVSPSLVKSCSSLLCSVCASASACVFIYRPCAPSFACFIFCIFFLFLSGTLSLRWQKDVAAAVKWTKKLWHPASLSLTLIVFNMQEENNSLLLLLRLFFQSFFKGPGMVFFFFFCYTTNRKSKRQRVARCEVGQGGGG